MSRVAAAALAALLITSSALAQSGPLGPGWTYRDGLWVYSAEQEAKEELARLEAEREARRRGSRRSCR